MRLGLLMPGRRCDLCDALLLFAAVTTPLGGMFCTSHGDLPNCKLCSAPFRGGGDFCEQCAASVVKTQEQVRQVLPRVRDVLHAMGVRLSPPVHVQLIDHVKMRDLNPNESGMVTGVTTMLGQQVTAVHIVAGLPEITFGSTVAHECMHAWMTQNGFPKIERKIAEGLCEMVSYRFLRDQTDPRAQLVRRAMDSNPDPIYGDGFRMVKESVRRHGMNPVLETVKAIGRLP